MPAYEEPRPPGRPALPFTFWALVAVIVSEQVLLRLAPSFGRCLQTIAVVLFISGTAAFICRARGRDEGVRFTAVLASAACAGLIVASMGVSTCRACADALMDSPVSAWRFSVTGDARLSHGRYRVRAHAQREGAVSADVWLYAGERLYPGMRLSGIGRCQALADNDWGAASRAQGICCSVTLSRVVRREARGGLLGAIDSYRRLVVGTIEPDVSVARAFIAACVAGERSGFDAFGLETDLRRCGVSHLVAVSGTHLAIVAATYASALDASQARAKARSVVLVVGTGVFVLVCGAPASAVRAWIMVSVHGASVFAGRRSHGLSALCAAAIAMALIDPFVTGQLSYQLSVAAVLGIYMVNPYMRYVVEVLCAHGRLHRAIPSRIARRVYAFERYVRDLVALSITAQVVTLPITASAFSEISLVAPIANLAASPLMALLTVLGLVSSALMGAPPLAQGVLACAEPAGDLLAAFLKALSGMWFSAIEVPAFARPASIAVLIGMLVLAWYSPRISRRIIAQPACAVLAAVLIWYLRCRYAAPARVVVLDVGQGDAILVQEGPHAVLVDAGPAGPLDDALMRASVFHLDAIVLSHLHNDHYGGVADLAGRVPCERIIVAAGSAPFAPPELVDAAQALDAYPFGEISYRDTVSFGHFSLTVLAPACDVDGLQNEDSLFMLLIFDDGARTMSALLTGDGEAPELAAAISQCDVRDIDILKVGHHGSEGSITSTLAAALSPAYAVCSAGEGNEFGHPHAATVRVLERAGAAFLCTKDAGDIVLVPTERGGCPRRRFLP